MSAMICQYLVTGLLWSIYASRMQHGLYGDSTKLWQYSLLAVLNVAIWPVGLVLAIILCPLVKPVGGSPDYVNTQSCRHLK